MLALFSEIARRIGRGILVPPSKVITAHPFGRHFSIFMLGSFPVGNATVFWSISFGSRGKLFSSCSFQGTLLRFFPHDWWRLGPCSFHTLLLTFAIVIVGFHSEPEAEWVIPLVQVPVSGAGEAAGRGAGKERERDGPGLEL